MKRIILAAVLMATVGMSTAWAQPAPGPRELTCRFEQKDRDRDKGKEEKNVCTATVRQCPGAIANNETRCKPVFKVKCNGLQVFYDEEFAFQVQDQNGIGQSLIGDQYAGYAHIAVDTSLMAEPIDRVVGILYLTPFERLPGKCSYSTSGAQ